jgi:enoyl-CoA hydratase/carnithine racemase
VSPSLVSSRRDGRVARITLERPEALNAISGALAGDLAAALSRVADDPAAWVVVLGAAGERAFCVGADLKERAGLSAAGWEANRERVRALFAALRAVPQPTIASVFGFALGGGLELALSCDLVVAAEGAQLGLPETRVGLVPGGGGTQLLARRVGPMRAKELVFTGRRVGAAEALGLGLLTRVVPRDDLERATEDLAEEICRSSPAAVREAKGAIDGGLGVPLESGLELEDGAWRRAVATRDREEGIAAFTERRAPRWENA